MRLYLPPLESQLLKQQSLKQALWVISPNSCNMPVVNLQRHCISHFQGCEIARRDRQAVVVATITTRESTELKDGAQYRREPRTILVCNNCERGREEREN